MLLALLFFLCFRFCVLRFDGAYSGSFPLLRFVGVVVVVVLVFRVFLCFGLWGCGIVGRSGYIHE